MKKTVVTICSMLAGMSLMAQSVTTERQYLSGTGCDDMVEWDFLQLWVTPVLGCAYCLF